MVTLDDKFEHFNRRVLDKAQMKYEEQLREVDGKNQELLEVFKRDLEERAKEMKIKAVQLASHEKKLRLSRVQLERKRRIMLVKDELMEKLIQSVRQELNQYTLTEAYGEFLKRRVEEFNQSMDDFDGVVVQMKQVDYDRYGKWIVQSLGNSHPEIKGFVEYEVLRDEYIGGVVFLNREKTIRFDATLYAMLEDWRERIGELLHDTFNKAGMSDE